MEEEVFEGESWQEEAVDSSFKIDRFICCLHDLFDG